MNYLPWHQRLTQDTSVAASLVSRTRLQPRNMASKIITPIPAHPNLLTHEIRIHLSGLSLPNLGQPSLLRRHPIDRPTRMPSDLRSVESTLPRPLHQPKYGPDSHWRRQRVLRPAESATPDLGYMASADGAEKKARDHRHLCYRLAVSTIRSRSRSALMNTSFNHLQKLQPLTPSPPAPSYPA